MRPRTTLVLFLSVLVVASLLWVSGRIDRAVRAFRAEEPLLRPLSGGITRVEIQSGGERVHCVWAGSTWMLAEPYDEPADDGAVARVLGALERLRSLEVITAGEREDRSITVEDYGLVVPRARVAVTDGLGRQELLIGADAPMGRSVYVMRSGQSDVHAVDRDLLAALPAGPADLRDRAVFAGAALRASRLEIESAAGGFIQLARSPEGWHIQQPVAAPADQVVVARMLEQLFASRIREFVDDPAAAAATEGAAAEGAADHDGRAEALRLTDEAAARVRVWVGNDDAGQELILGKVHPDRPDLVYAKRRGRETVFMVDATLLGAFVVPVAALRDRRVFPIDPGGVEWVFVGSGDRKLTLSCRDAGRWWVIEPVKWPADGVVVRDVVDQLCRLEVAAYKDSVGEDLAALGLDPPAWVVRLAGAAPAPATGSGDDPGLTVSFAPCTGDTAVVYARYDDADELMMLRPSPTVRIGRELVDPLVFRERTMLAVSPDDVRQIVVAAGTNELVAARDASGAWAPPAGGAAVLHAEGVQDVLFFSANLRALRIESHNPADLAPYGLDHPRAVVTLGLTGDEGIQKKVLMGGAARGDAVYAMVQGQDVVFVLGKGVAERLAAGLLVLP